MRRNLGVIALLALLAGGLAAPPARAGGEALVGLADIGAEGWARDRQVREILADGLGFAAVQIAIDATPGELPERVRAFLSRAAAPGDRRVVWISGPSAAAGSASPCPAADMPRIVPRAAALIVAPDCYAEFLALPPGALHLGLRDAAAPIAATGIDAAPPVVLVTLPADTAEAIRRADAIVLDALRAAAGGAMTPALLLQRLRYELRVDGSGYTPSLEASAAEAAWSRRYLTPPRPGGDTAWRPAGAAGFEGRLARPRAGRIELFATADATAPPVLSLAGRQAVTVLRTGPGGTMGYARVPGALFGWVKLDDLE